MLPILFIYKHIMNGGNLLKKLFLTYILIIIIISLLIPSGKNNYLSIHTIDVGQGDSILIQTPNSKNILIDGGDDNSHNIVSSYLKKQNVSEFEKNKKETFYAIYAKADIVDFEYYLLDKFFEKDYVSRKDIINYLEKYPKNSALVGYLIDDILDNESLNLDFEQRYIFGIFLASYMHDRIIENPKKIQEFIELNDYLNSLEIYDIFKIIDLDFNHDSESLTPDSYKKLFKSYKNEMKRKNEK